MNIITAATEAEGIAKSGGLADVVASLNKEWHLLGHKCLIVLPKYKNIDLKEGNFVPTDLTLIVPMGEWTEFARLWKGILPKTEIPVYLIEHNVYFDRNGIYGEHIEYPDNDRRFIFFSKAVLETCKALNFKPDIIHSHDYHTAFTMAFLKTHYRNEPVFENTKGVYTIHNLGYQGKFSPNNAMKFAGYDFNNFYIGSWFEQFGVVNSMKVGIMFADKLTTVSPTYSKEIREEYYSEGLMYELNIRAADLIGILNGPNYSEWSPENDDLLFKKYNITDISGKLENKQILLNNFGVKFDIEKPLFGIVSRMTEQKGFDLLFGTLENYIESGAMRLILLGSGETRYEEYFKYLNSRFPKDVLIYLGYNNQLSHNIFAASDYYLMPSRYEPCGLTQMYALKYGSIPIVRKTGGLADTITEYNTKNQDGNGFSFWSYNRDELSYAINRALSIYQDETHWTQIRKNAMSSNFSSEDTAKEYLKVFQWAKEMK